MLESELFKLLETTADAGFLADRQGTTLYWNRAAAKLFGYPAAQAVGQSCGELLDGRGALGVSVCRPDCAILELCRAGREIPNFDMEVRTSAGARVWVNVSVLQVRDPQGRRQFSIHLLRDIAARKRTEELAEKFLQAARQFVASAAEPPAGEPVSPLTPQEQTILRNLAKGRSPSETAARLGITPRTLRNHLYNVNRKLGTTNRLAAVVHATQRGLL